MALAPLITAPPATPNAPPVAVSLIVC